MLGGTPNANEAVVLISALVAGWASGAHPGIAAVTRYFAVAAAAATGMQFSDPDVLLSLVVGGVTAFAAALAAWKWSGIPTDTNVMDWRTGVRREGTVSLELTIQNAAGTIAGVLIAAAILPHLLGARIYDVVVGCVLAVAGTLTATWPRPTPKYG